VLRSLSLGARSFSSILGRREFGLGVAELRAEVINPVPQRISTDALGVPARLRSFFVLLGPLNAYIGCLRPLQRRMGVGELGLHHVEAVS
jgi:hypothetical protein